MQWPVQWLLWGPSVGGGYDIRLAPTLSLWGRANEAGLLALGAPSPYTLSGSFGADEDHLRGGVLTETQGCPVWMKGSSGLQEQQVTFKLSLPPSLLSL